MMSTVVSCNVKDDQEDVVKVVARYDLIVLSIVDDSGTLVCIVTPDDTMDVASDKATDDFQ